FTAFPSSANKKIRIFSSVMSSPEKEKSPQVPLKSWLDAIQQESWQLELLISGFVLFLLTSGWGPIVDMEYDLYLQKETEIDSDFLELAYYVFRTAYLSLLLCLMVHVVLRGVWIAAVGLRSVSGEIDYESLRFQDRFTDRLRRRLGSFDEYIERLERNCSVIFSFAFLLIFCFLSLVTCTVAVTFLQKASMWIIGQEYTSNSVFGGAGVISFVLALSSIVYCLDFITLGLLKRSRWTARPYYYIYIFMGWITLARFYRPLYYNLIDNRFGRRLAFFLPVIILLILVGVSVIQVRYDYFPYQVGDGKIWLDANSYDDEDGNPLDRMWRMTLASRYANNNYVEAFIPYRPAYHNDRLRRIDPEIEAMQYVGFKLKGAFKAGTQHNRDADAEQILVAFDKFFKLSINDSLPVNVPPLFHFHPEREQAGVTYVIPVHDLPVGRHALKVQVQLIEDDSLTWSNGRTVYFYK
ncbi:MAG: hypothetical protein AAFZ52_08220, partial [Bacteroidota bacterium]